MLVFEEELNKIYKFTSMYGHFSGGRNAKHGGDFVKFISRIVSYGWLCLFWMKFYTPMINMVVICDHKIICKLFMIPFMHVICMIEFYWRLFHSA
jgi:hypothetical protein